MLLVCIACPVSVFVRPVCLSRRDLRGTRDTTPDVCSISLLLAAAAPALGFDGAFLWEVEPSIRAIDPGLKGAPLRRRFTWSPQGAGLRRDRVARSTIAMGQKAHH